MKAIQLKQVAKSSKNQDTMGIVFLAVMVTVVALSCVLMNALV